MPNDALLSEHEKMLYSMATEEFTSELLALLKSRASLIFLTCKEEKRMKNYFRHLSAVKGYNTYIWDCYLGLLDLATGKKVNGSENLMTTNAIVDRIIDQARQDGENAKALKDQKTRGNIYILLDFHYFISEPSMERRLKTLAGIESMTHIIMTGPNFVTTDTIEGVVSVIDFPYPNEKEIENSLDTIISAIKEQGKFPNLEAETKGRKNELIKAANGLTLREAQLAFSKSIVMHKTFDIQTILKEKEQIIRKKGILEFFPSNYSLKDVGGLKNLTHWLEIRKSAFSNDAINYGLPAPRGILLLGYPGVGKSLCAKAAAGLFEIPLLKLDFGRLFGSLVGESEKTARDVIKLAEAVAPAILWFDEIEKGLSGAKSSGQSDGGTTSRVVSTFLTWMQEKTSPIFVFATANDHTQIPPEFMRRFDETFFVDLPNKEERKDIFGVLLKRYKRGHLKFNLDLLSSKTSEYSGAEIEKIIVTALFSGFSNQKREITEDDLLKAISEFKPLYQVRREDFEPMKEWSKDRCVPANSIEIDGKQKSNIGLDLT